MNTNVVPILDIIGFCIILFGLVSSIVILRNTFSKKV